MTIGQVARQTDTSVETLRYYEREGLIPEAARTAAGYRRYPHEIVRRVRFIQRAKKIGFSLREIGELLSLRTDPSCTCADVRTRAQAKIATIDERRQELDAMRAALSRLVQQCDGQGPVSECPILDALDTREILNR